ncbi:MAG: hypothetical protein FWG63_13075 [Defluviitaleaceae bacterium]|nr:hypothetical protein [Defluviitaleaceae bacterium]
MTIRDLIKIIIVAVERVLFLENLRVKAIVFNKENTALVNTAMGKINTKGDVYEKIPSNDETDILFDILFIDEMPLRYYSSVALGMGHDPFTLFVQKALAQNKKIVILKEPQKIENKNYKMLIENYKRILVSYGVIFAGDIAGSCTHPDIYSYAENCGSVYEGNVLSATDILNLSKTTNIIYIDDTTIVTALAYEQAASVGVTIEKRLL